MPLQVYKEISEIKVVAESTLSLPRLCLYVLVMLKITAHGTEAQRLAGDYLNNRAGSAMPEHHAKILARALRVSIDDLLRNAEHYWAERDTARAMADRHWGRDPQ